MEKKKDVVETNGDIPSSSCRVLQYVSETNEDTPASPLRVLKHVAEANGDTPASPLRVVKHVSEANDDTPASPLRVLKHVSETNEDTPSPPLRVLQHVAEANVDTPSSPLRVLKHVSESNDDTPSSPLRVLKHVAEANVDTPSSPLRALKHVSESNDDTPSLKHVSVTSDDTPSSPLRVLQHVSETSDDTPSSPLRVLQHVSEANYDTPASPCRVLQHVSETNDDTPSSPLRMLKHVSETNDDTPPSPLHVLKHVSETTDDTPSSTLRVLKHVSDEVVKVTSEPMTGVYTGSPNMPPLGPPLHRRAKSEFAPGHTRSNSFQRLKSHIQKAWQGVGNLEENPQQRWTFNPEVLANQKRQWYEIHSKKTDLSKYKEPTSLFEHFVVVGLHSDSNLEAVEDAFAKRKTWELSGRNEKVLRHHRESSIPTLEPQILFRYPPGKRLGMRPKDLPSFCFPEGVQARLMERTPSLSDLNAVVYGQEHLGRDNSSFIFSFKVADNATLFGVCLHVQEIVQRPPGVLGCASPLSPSSFCRFLVSAPRCYCLLTRVPFFELHYEMLNSIITQERLNRITQFVSEMTVPDYAPSITKTQEQMTENVGCPSRDCSADWMASAIPVDSAVALTKAAAGIISDDEVPSYSIRASEPQTPESVSANGGSDYCPAKELDSANRRNSQCSDDYASETSETRSDCFERIMGNYGNCPSSPEFFCERLGSSESLFSSVRSMGSDDEDEEVFSEYDKSTTVDVIMGWAREHNNDLLQIICGYHSLHLPPRGGEVVFQPLEHLQAINYRRLPVAALGLGNCPDIELQGSIAAEVNVRLAAAEEAVALSIWTVATVCRVLSLESVLALFSGVLLEKQVVVVCPNLGVLSAVVLSLIPMIRPFQWQSLLLPVLPRKMIDFLDAPVPFIVGIQHKPADLMLKTTNSIHVNVLKDQVKSSYMPSLPRYGELVSELRPIHARLSCQSSIAERHPVYKCNEVQAEAAWQFCNVIRQYLESLCSDLRSHTITSVQSNSDRVSLLLKDSFIDSFPGRDRPFIKQFVDTQLFSVLSDSRLASFEY